MSLREGDLAHTVLKKISIDEFEPKTGDAESVLVLGFYVTEKSVGDDLYHYLSGSAVEIRDVEVSPNPNDDGYHMVFVELDRNSSVFDRIKQLIDDVQKLTGKLAWMVRTHLNDEYVSLQQAEKYVIQRAKDYVTRDQYDAKQQAEKEQAMEDRRANPANQHSSTAGFKMIGNGVWAHQKGRIYYDNTYSRAPGQGHYRVRFGSQDRLSDDLPKKFKTLQGAVAAFNQLLQAENENSAAIMEFLKPTNLLHADVAEGKLNMRDARGNINLKIVNYGEGKTMMKHYGISESAINVDFDKTLFDKLKSMLGDMAALPIDRYIIIYNPKDQTDILITQPM